MKHVNDMFLLKKWHGYHFDGNNFVQCLLKWIWKLCSPSLLWASVDVCFRVVANNLYPFEKTIAKPDVFVPEAVEQIDIGVYQTW